MGLMDSTALWLTLFSGGVRLTDAQSLLRNELDGLAIDFTSDDRLSSTGFYGDVAVKDRTTPANVYNSSPTTTNSSFLTYTSPSNKLVMGPTGTLRYPAHNLFLQSEDFSTTWTRTAILAFGSGSTVNATAAPNGTTTADLITPDTTTAAHHMAQTVSVLGPQEVVIYVKPNGYLNFGIREQSTTGAQASFACTGAGSVIGTTTGTATSVSASISAEANGWYKCTFNCNQVGTVTTYRLYVLKPTYVEANMNSDTWTPDGTSGQYWWGAHLRRTPSDSTYLATTSAARYALPIEFNTSGVSQGLLVEEARTNLCLQSNDLTQAVWVKTSATAAKTATGPDGAANSASTLTASAANGVALQNIVSASAARSGSVYLKRRTGTGAVTIAIGETTGSELVTNGTFASGVTGWTQDGGATITWSSGTMVVTNSAASNSAAYQTITTTAGKLYRITCRNAGATTLGLCVGTTLGGTQNYSVLLSSGATENAVFVATAATTYVYVRVQSAVISAAVTADDISVLEVAETTVDLSSGNWVRATIENKTITNPCVAIKLATSGDAVDVAYADLESGAFITSPIETFASTVTRAVDNISLATSAFPWDAATGTAYIRLNPKAINIGSDQYALAFGPNGRLCYQSSTVYRFFDGTNTADAGTAVAGTAANYAIGFSSTTTAAVLNGGSVTAGTFDGGLGTGTLYFGSNAGGTVFNGYISKVLIAPRRYSNAELQTLTT